MAAAKLSFIPGKTYSYEYTGKSTVQLKGVEGGQVETKWEKQVLLTVLGPCDIAVSFKGSKVDGKTGKFQPLNPMVSVYAPTANRPLLIIS